MSEEITIKETHKIKIGDEIAFERDGLNFAALFITKPGTLLIEQVNDVQLTINQCKKGQLLAGRAVKKIMKGSTARALACYI